VLADWLDEQGGKDNQFRADFIRTHCRLAREEPWAPAWRTLNAHWFKLEEKVSQLALKDKLPWVKHLKGRVRAWYFERGLIGELTLYSKRFVAEGALVLRARPDSRGEVRDAELHAGRGETGSAVRVPAPGADRAASTSTNSRLKDADLNRLGASPHSRDVRFLGLGSDNPLTKAALPKLLKALPLLSEFNFRSNRQFRDGHAKELAKCPEFARVTVLDLTNAALQADGVVALVSSPHATALSVLRLAPEREYERIMRMPACNSPVIAKKG